MSATIEQPPVTEEPAPGAGQPPEAAEPPVEAARLCASCAAPLAAGQDWCLECGSAQPGRLGDRAGWRAAVTVMGSVAVLALGAGAAAYAALASDAEREASSPPPPAAAPVVSTPPAQTAPPATTQETTPPVEAPKSDSADVPPVKAPESETADTPPPADDTPADTGSGGATDTSGDTSSGDTSSGSSGSSGDGTTTTAEQNGSGLQSIPLSAGAASTYDPDQCGGDLVGDPADAIDGKASTAWEAPVDPQGNVGIGLAITLDEAKLIKKLRFGADTPGFTVEVYASNAKSLPPDALDARWAKIDTLKDVGLESTVKVGQRPFRHVLLWITKQPADTKVAIPEVDLLQ